MRTFRPLVLLPFLALLAFSPLPLQADPIEIDVYPFAVLKMELGLPDGSSEIVTFNGPAEMYVFFEGVAEGDAVDDDGDGRDEVSAQFVDLDMHGVSPSAGSIRLIMNSAVPSMGVMEESVNNTAGRLDVPPFTAAGQIDVSIPTYFTFEFVDQSGMTLHNLQDQDLRGVFTHKPANYGELLGSYKTTDLVDDAGRPTGWWCRVIYCLLLPVIEKDGFDAVEAELELRDPSGTPETVLVDGQGQIHVIFEGPEEGIATDDDDDGVDEVDTEIVSLRVLGV